MYLMDIFLVNFSSNFTLFIATCVSFVAAYLMSFVLIHLLTIKNNDSTKSVRPDFVMF